MQVGGPSCVMGSALLSCFAVAQQVQTVTLEGDNWHVSAASPSHRLRVASSGAQVRSTAA